MREAIGPEASASGATCHIAETSPPVFAADQPIACESGWVKMMNA